MSYRYRRTNDTPFPVLYRTNDIAYESFSPISKAWKDDQEAEDAFTGLLDRISWRISKEEAEKIMADSIRICAERMKKVA